MLLNIIIVTIFLLLLLVCILPFEVSISLFNLFLLNMQTTRSWFQDYFLRNDQFNMKILEVLGVTHSSDVVDSSSSVFDPQNEEITSINDKSNTSDITSLLFDITVQDQNEEFIIRSEILPVTDEVVDQFDVINSMLYDIFNLLCFFEIWFWVFFPFFLYLFIIYFLHAILGLYSAYVDYFQKNPNHIDSMRGFLPAFFICLFILFIISVIFIYFFLLCLHYILWLLFL